MINKVGWYFSTLPTYMNIQNLVLEISTMNLDLHLYIIFGGILEGILEANNLGLVIKSCHAL
jgi:hypothetical protein